MGTLRSDGTVVEFDDRTLTHLQIVIVQRFRAGDSVLLSWIDPLKVGGGRSSIWLTPTAPLAFTFTGARVPAIDRAWVDALLLAAASGPGLIVTDELGAVVQAISVARVHRGG